MGDVQRKAGASHDYSDGMKESIGTEAEINVFSETLALRLLA